MSRAEEILRTGYARLFAAETVFLTGATGSLGGCLLYKLALQLPTRKVFILVRGSDKEAIEKWRRNMPEQSEAIAGSKKVHFVLGDILKAEFGIDPSTLERLRDEVTLVIHAAANISFAANISHAVKNNCLPCLELAQMVSQFRRLRLLIQISTAYVSSFLPDGFVHERLYHLTDDGDAEEELANILSTGNSPQTARFSSSYAHAKQIMERLLIQRYPLLPVLIVRPTIFAPSLRDPFPLYGPEDSTPMNKFARFFFSDRGGTQVWHATEGHRTGANVLDEIPVDLVANAILLHGAARTKGIIHLGAELYMRRTFDEFLAETRNHAPPAVQRHLPTVVFTEDRSTPQCFLAELVRAGTRDWRFDCGKSYWVKQVAGPLSLEVCRQEVEQITAKRLQEIYRSNALDSKL
ncbi:hypothetical protein ASPZODRAFT_68636 [Penicilliopsis zonata CBS 506.65]|uniref:Fatty acyl-CoA reductase n=1 Tax=Penicilliopsis zonata CBS 506.65 TaxID=1073090 RepID=A0A1L9SFK2_9EURO|nr:hypothetical protein ASPZODRAFT_68636 [Penicilliopsis zonata CBS 506.65]OJJ45867.1 hypothetical protein ASPZODRAFT_68636 [Penicilliopsis zonata CBS 506.65]